MRYDFRKSVVAGAVAATMAFSGGTASAATFNLLEDSNGTILSATIDIVFNSLISATESLFDVTVSNTTADQPGLNTLVSFGLNADPDSVTFDVDDNTNTSTIFAFGGEANPGQGLGSFEFCFEVDDNGNCNGTNPTDGLTDTSAPEIFQLSFSHEANAEIIFTSALARFQQVGPGDGGSEFIVCDTDKQVCDEPPVGVIPLPGSLPLMAGGLLVGGFFVRRKVKS